MSLKIEAYIPQNGIFPVSSTLISGEREAILVDAQFQASHARRVVDLVRASGRNLTTIFVSHSDPDFYFGLDTIRAAFPDARILATPQTSWLISATKDDKLAVWKDQLGEDAPHELIVPDAATGSLTIEGETIEIRQDPTDPTHAFLWIPSAQAIVGGIFVFAGTHPWMADTQSLEAVDRWIGQLEAMLALQPAKLVPGHTVGQATDVPDTAGFLRDYLKAWRDAAAGATTSGDIVEAMVATYPDLPGRDFLEMGAKVFTGEVAWKVTALYPPIGRTAVVNFGAMTFGLDFTDHRRMTFTSLDGKTKGFTDTVLYTAVPVGPSLYMVYWSEPNTTGANVVHVQDYANGNVYTNIAGTDGSFVNLTGTLMLSPAA